MRSEQVFSAYYKDQLNALNPSAAQQAKDRLSTLGLTELCFTALNQFFPEQDVSCLPHWLLGYPFLLPNSAENPALQRALATLRHLCHPFSARAVWLEACREHAQFPETLRCYTLHNGRAIQRQAAAPSLLAHFQHTLSQPVAWVQRVRRVATAGEAIVHLNHNANKVVYDVPFTPPENQIVTQHRLHARPSREPIQVRLADVLAIAERIDAREAQPDWPRAHLPPLNLTERLQKTLKIESLSPDFFDGETLTLDGANHLVGMLSSGKSTLAMGLIFALTLGTPRKRIAVIVADTLQGATLASRLRQHNVTAALFSSFKNREKHLNAVHWQQSLSSTAGSLSSLGHLVQSFNIACPLDGFQPADLPHIQGAHRQVNFPNCAEKPCHTLYQVSTNRSSPRSCPLWAQCPAHAQQRSAVDAQVLIMNPWVFAEMTPDKWTIDQHITLPELLQFVVDLVIVDEADAVQKILDEIFAPPELLMGKNQGVYVPAISACLSKNIQEKSGLQFSKAINARWQNKFHTFYRFIGDIYALLQNEQASLQPVYKNKSFTAAGLLYGLWHSHISQAAHPLPEETLEAEFLQVIRVATSISEAALSSNTEPPHTTVFSDARFQTAATALQELARQLFSASYYADLLPYTEKLLTEQLEPFCQLTPEEVALLATVELDNPEHTNLLTKRRTNALIILLAVVAELALSHYNWLIRAQQGVNEDFGFAENKFFYRFNHIIRHYRSLLPSNPAGTSFGLLYDEPSKEHMQSLGGTLTILNHLGVGRYLLTHLHDLLRHEGQRGPNVLLLSGTSWAGGSSLKYNTIKAKFYDCASPTFDVQVPVKGVLLQPDIELAAIQRSIFSLVNMRDNHGRQIKVSGTQRESRHANLTAMAQQFALRQDHGHLLERHWLKLAKRWGDAALENRRRALLVVNSYEDAAVVAHALGMALKQQGCTDSGVFYLVNDKNNRSHEYAQALHRSLVERFGNSAEKSILVAPIQVVSRGHNILNNQGKAAISSLYFLHRPHPRPDDLTPTIGRLNRFALQLFQQTPPADAPTTDLNARTQWMRQRATEIIRYSLDFRGGYQMQPYELKAQFAWDMLTQLWQTIGRGIRGGCPVFVGFVDYKFAPLSFDWHEGAPPDTGHSSALVQVIQQLAQAMNAQQNSQEYRVAQLLYEPFYRALCQTEGLKYR